MKKGNGKGVLKIALVIIVVYIIYYIFTYEYLVKVLSQTDNNYYYVKNLPDKQQASNLLGTINKNIEILLEFINKDNKMPFINRLNRKYSHNILSENNENNSTSYNLNKSYIILCLRHRENGTKNTDFVDINTMMYVVIHELSHLCSLGYVSEKNHSTNKEFMYIFNYLLKSSEQCGVYTKMDFKLNPVPYCGMTIL